VQNSLFHAKASQALVLNFLLSPFIFLFDLRTCQCNPSVCLSLVFRTPSSYASSTTRYHQTTIHGISCLHIHVRNPSCRQYPEHLTWLVTFLIQKCDLPWLYLDTGQIRMCALDSGTNHHNSTVLDCQRWWLPLMSSIIDLAHFDYLLLSFLSSKILKN
jgi:hypothetical protein